MIPFGPWHPDRKGLNAPVMVEAVNVAPAVDGFRPMPSAVTATLALEDDCCGLVTVIDEDGDPEVFVGTATNLYRLDSDTTWEDVTRASGGDYSVGSGERWQFTSFGSRVIAVAIGNATQKFTLGSSSNFEALGGSPPQGRFITTVRDFVVIGGLSGDERTIHWSAIGNPEGWTPGTASSDTQTFQSGGPVRGLLGGETGYVFQSEAIQRMTFLPGSEAIFQFDEIEGGRGLAAPYSLVQVGSQAYFLATDGFYRFSLAGAAAEPIGVGKWARTFTEAIQSGLEATVIGGIDPVNKLILWAFPARSDPGTDLTQVLAYDWSLDEATLLELPLQAIGKTLSTGVTLDTMNDFGTLDELPFTLDSPVWRGGAPLLGLVGSDRKLAYASGRPMAARLVTTDGKAERRTLISGTRPNVDTSEMTVEIAARERESDALTYAAPEVMETTGIVSAWSSGFLARARVRIDAGASWTRFSGLETNPDDGGAR